MEQLSLFEESFDPRIYNAKLLPNIEGLHVFYEFISENEEKELLKKLDSQPWLQDLTRRVQHYGYKYDYKARKIDNSMYLGNLPEWLQNLAVKMHTHKLIDFMPDQAIINEYEPGQGISPHIDCEPCFGDTIISLSLGSSAVMNFESKPNSKEKIEIFLEPRSLVVMKEESRYNFYHSIPARKKDNIENHIFHRTRRISVTFRKIIL